MSHRYFVETPIQTSPSGEGHAALWDAEAHHLIHVMRAGPGDEVLLIDGSGGEFPAVVERIGRREVELRVLHRREIDREAQRRVTLAVALPKGDRQRWLVEKATELGVTRLVPLRTERGVAQPVDKAIERLRRTVVEASKQCGRTRLMDIAQPVDWPEVAATATAGARLIAHPGGPPSDPPSDQPATVIAAIGPEGGFSQDELSLAEQNAWHPVDLGPRILRVETAALAMAARLTIGGQ